MENVIENLCFDFGRMGVSRHRYHRYHLKQWKKCTLKTQIVDTIAYWVFSIVFNNYYSQNLPKFPSKLMHLFSCQRLNSIEKLQNSRAQWCQHIHAPKGVILFCKAFQLRQTCIFPLKWKCLYVVQRSGWRGKRMMYMANFHCM